jgi:hypothetical protein
MKDPIHLRRAARRARWFSAASLALAAVTAHAAVVEGRTSEGHRYVTGGIGTDEVEALRQEAPAFSLQLITAARTGAYLAGTHVRITGPGNNVVLDTTLDAPWLLVDLPGGRYTVRATHSGTTVEQRLTIAPGHPQRVVLHFDAPVDGGDTPPAPDASGVRVFR